MIQNLELAPSPRYLLEKQYRNLSSQHELQ